MALPEASTDPRAAQVQIDLLRAAGTARRFERARSLSQTVIELSRRAIHERHPELSEREVALRWVELHYGADLARRLREHLASRE